jgi:hypothetical protein
MRQASSARANVARLYLGMDRAIPYTAPYPASIGYHPGRNALIAIATDSTAQITAVQTAKVSIRGGIAPGSTVSCRRMVMPVMPDCTSMA